MAQIMRKNTDMTVNDRQFEIQASLYTFPYHYLPTLDESGTIAIHRFLSWGLDYLTYMSFVVDLATNELNTESLLDVGCGDGRLLNMLRGKVPRLMGVDLVEQAILFARAFNPDLEFLVGDVSTVPGQFQTTTLIEVLEHIPDGDIQAFVEKVAGKTTESGRLIVSVPTINVQLSRKHHRHYNLSLLKEHLSPAFTVQDHWFLSKWGWRIRFLEWLLQNEVAIVLPGVWRRMVWCLHRRYTYMATDKDGMHLVAVAVPASRKS